MKARILTVVAVVAFAASAWQLGNAQTKVEVSNFKIHVEKTPTGIKAQCLTGCAWKELSWSCDDAKNPCKAEVDQHGVGGVVK